MSTIATELTTRVCVITLIFSIISYFIIQKHQGQADQLAVDIPLLFVTFGVVMLISILFCLRKYHVWNARKNDGVNANKI
jgi:hypothetical protein